MIKKTIYYESQTITTSGDYTFKCKSLYMKNVGSNSVSITPEFSLKSGESLSLSDVDFEIEHTFNIAFVSEPGSLKVLMSKVKTEI